MSPWTGSPAGYRSGTEGAPRGRPAGFTLIEVLVAFVILALALGALLPSFATGLRGIDVADHYTTAALLAESRLAEVGVAIPLQEGTTGGDLEGGFTWHLEIAARADLDPGDRLPVRAYGVVVTVAWVAGNEERSITLETLRLGPPRGSRP